MLNISDLSYEELEKLSDFFVGIGCLREAGKVLDYLAEELDNAKNESELNALENQTHEG